MRITYKNKLPIHKYIFPNFISTSLKEALTSELHRYYLQFQALSPGWDGGLLLETTNCKCP